MMDVHEQVWAAIEVAVRGQEASLERLREEAFLVQCSINADGVELMAAYGPDPAAFPGVACRWPRRVTE